MKLKANQVYRFTVHFQPTLTLLPQFREINRRMHDSPNAWLIGITPSKALIDFVFPEDTTQYSKGMTLFKVGPRSKPVSAIVTKIQLETLILPSV